MTGKEYIKVLLYAYPKLDAIIGALADGAEIKALLSFRKPEDCLTIAQSIVEEIAAKERIAACKFFCFTTDSVPFNLKEK